MNERQLSDQPTNVPKAESADYTPEVVAPHPGNEGAVSATSAGSPPSAVIELLSAGQAVVDRWETPLWKDAPHTGEFIARLRKACEAVCAEPSGRSARSDSKEPSSSIQAESPSADRGTDEPMTLAEQVAHAQRTVAGWSDERRANVQIEGGAKP